MHFLTFSTLFIFFSFTLGFKNFLFYKGTNYCGPGHKAEALGKYKEVDSCCKQHDECPHKIRAGKTAWHLTNSFKIATLSHCECDRKYVLSDNFGLLKSIKQNAKTYLEVCRKIIKISLSHSECLIFIFKWYFGWFNWNSNPTPLISRHFSFSSSFIQLFPRFIKKIPNFHLVSNILMESERIKRANDNLPQS